MITDMDNWTNIRRDVLVDGMSRREACNKYNLNFRTIQKILSHTEPPGYDQHRRSVGSGMRTRCAGGAGRASEG